MDNSRSVLFLLATSALLAACQPVDAAGDSPGEETVEEALSNDATVTRIAELNLRAFVVPEIDKGVVAVQTTVTSITGKQVKLSADAIGEHLDVPYEVQLSQVSYSIGKLRVAYAATCKGDFAACSKAPRRMVSFPKTNAFQKYDHLDIDPVARTIVFHGWGEKLTSSFETAGINVPEGETPFFIFYTVPFGGDDAIGEIVDSKLSFRRTF